MRIFIAGRHGQLGRALARALPVAGHDVLSHDLPDLDLTDESTITAIVNALPWRPDLIVNAAAYTAVDAAEDEAARAFAVNAKGPGLLAAQARSLGAAMLHVSTDYVFDGSKHAPYREDDVPGPMNVYGASKLAGEKAVMASNPRSAILRTAWLCSAEGSNFLRTMVHLAEEGRATVGVVADQHGAPSFAEELAAAVLAMAPQLVAAAIGDPSLGVFHLTGTPHTTWHDFAAAIFEGLSARGIAVPRLQAIATADFPCRATRPLDTRLDCTKIASVYGIQCADWRASLRRCLDTLTAPKPL